MLVYVGLLDIGRVVFFDGCGTESVGLNPYLLHPARGWDSVLIRNLDKIAGSSKNESKAAV